MVMEQERIFYVYAHARASDGIVAYVGKGKGRRAWSRQGRNDYWRNTVAKHGLAVEIVARDLTEEEALDMERALIAHHRLWGNEEKLTNLTAGGEGSSGLTGEKSATYNPEILTFERIATGERFELTRVQARAQLGLSSSEVSDIISGGQKSSRGIRRVPAGESDEEAKEKRDYIFNARNNPELLLFERISTGERMFLTRLEARECLGLSKQRVSGLIYGDTKTSGGYRLIRN